MPPTDAQVTPAQPSRMLEYAPPRRGSFEWRPWSRVAGLLVAAVAAEVAAAKLACYTLGELECGMMMVAVLGAGLLTLVLSFFHRRAAALAILVVATLVVPYQALLGVRWVRLSREAERVIAYVEAQKAATGAYPADLRGYRSADAGVAGWITYSPDAAGTDFYIAYSIGSANTAHSYTRAGGWFYYPD
jgi:hypothetical protein